MGRLGRFAADPDSNLAPYTIMMPPPNVTGGLHIGHALTFTLQDLLVRYQRMRGRDVLWQPGTDHAGIATADRGRAASSPSGAWQTRLGRENFVARVWQWKEQSGGTITRQLRRLGASPDWRRERFTMDSGLAAAVRRVFVALYREGLIYRDKRLVNWDPEMHTVISDLEVDSRETKGFLWHIRYPVEGFPAGSSSSRRRGRRPCSATPASPFIPMTCAIADLVGKSVRLPLVGRLIPIVADEYADPETGSGAVKITPAHDFNDFEVGRRHGLAMLNIFDADARLNDAVPERYRGLDRFEARKKVVADLDADGLLDKVEDHTLMVPHHDRSGVVIEPWLTDQWFCDAGRWRQPAIAAVEDGRTRFVPRQWENTFFEWMRNIQPWCISRQLWWGHQIPAWYGPDGAVFVAESEAEALGEAEAKYGRAVVLRRDEDVLDTWFSSALWPFSTLGWPEQTAELAALLPRRRPGHRLRHHLLLGRPDDDDGLAFHGRSAVPHRLHPCAGARRARPEDVEVARQHHRPLGADRPLRLRCAAFYAGRTGRTRPRHQARREPGRGLSQFCDQIVECGALRRDERLRAGRRVSTPASLRQAVNRWIATAAADCAAAVTASLDAYRFDEAAARLYQFVWGTFCDWYIEFTKPILQGDDDQARRETQATMAWALGQILHLLHPLMPFITEELWRSLAGEDAGMLISAPWPEFVPGATDRAAASEMEWVVAAISAIRATRAEMNVPPAARVPLMVRDAEPVAAQRLTRHIDHFVRLARVEPIESAASVPSGAVQIVVDGATLILPLGEVVDLAREKARLAKEIGRLDSEIAKIAAKLGNPQFLAKAKPEVVEDQREREADAARDRDRLRAAYDRFAAV